MDDGRCRARLARVARRDRWWRLQQRRHEVRQAAGRQAGEARRKNDFGTLYFAADKSGCRLATAGQLQFLLLLLELKLVLLELELELELLLLRVQGPRSTSKDGRHGEDRKVHQTGPGRDPEPPVLNQGLLCLRARSTRSALECRR